MSSFKSNKNIQKTEGGPDRSVSDNQPSSVTLNELAMKAGKACCNFKLQQRSHTKTDLNPNEVQTNPRFTPFLIYVTCELFFFFYRHVHIMINGELHKNMKPHLNIPYRPASDG